ASATCTPSRYALMTGEYPWRKKGTGVLPGDAALVIEPERTTLAGMLTKAGYATGVVGKWHLGLGDGKAPLDWNATLEPGAKAIGFAESFLIPATGDRVPTVYVENGKVAGLDPNDPIAVRYGKPLGNEPTGKEHPELLKLHPSHGHDMTIVNGVSRIGFMTGGKSARWVDEDMADTLAKKAVSFVERHKKDPFFLYLATHDIHVPRVPHPRFAGKSGMGPRGDALLEFDDTVGKVLDALDRLNLSQNTLVILSSDNGPVVDDGYKDDAVAKLGEHRPAGPFRGGKYSLFEGGTRVPFVVRWPARVKPGTSDALVCQVDLLATLAKLVGQTLSKEAGPDSVNVLPALLGETAKGREELVEHAGRLSLRQGNWKLIPAGAGPARLAFTNVESGADAKVQLFDLAVDPGETQNLAEKHPERVKAMLARLAEIRGPAPR
ncbi:MAG: sulfatase-like hydrolase/transferase, partial [Isosphaeraceae bacterium]